MFRLTQLLIQLLLLTITLPAAADNAFLDKLNTPDKSPVQTEQQRFLPEDQAFPLSATLIDQQTLRLRWQPAQGYYLYRHAMQVNSDNAVLDLPLLPQGQQAFDEYLGHYQTYHNDITMTVPVRKHQDQSAITVGFQGCAASGYCYPPMLRQISIDWPMDTATAEYPILLPVANNSPAASPTAKDRPTKPSVVTKTTQLVSEQDKLSNLLSQHFFLIGILAFFGLGILLAFTPCVLPMIPILAGIVLGDSKNISGNRALVLASVYVLAVAVTYSIAGACAAMLGHNLQASMQHPVVLSLTALLFVVLALSLFGWFELRLPQWLDQKLQQLSHRQRGGSLVGAFMMGALSALIVSPCVTAPLVGALAYISQTGDVVLGASALFALGLGMGLPLIVFVTAGAKYLPKSGKWMERIKHFFGVLLLIVAFTLVGRFIHWPQAHDEGSVATSYSQHLEHIDSLSDLQDNLLMAKSAKMPVMVDFSADWCVSCKIMERTVLRHPDVAKELEHFKVLLVDVTANDANDREIMQQLEVFAPPTYVFYSASGKEIKGLRLVAETPKERFLATLQQVRRQ